MKLKIAINNFNARLGKEDIRAHQHKSESDKEIKNIYT